MSCVNTALVLLIFAQQRGELVPYLAALKACANPDALASASALSMEPPLPCRGAGRTKLGTTPPQHTSSLLQNLLELLHFWQEHYLHKDKDCSALEKVREMEMAISRGIT